MCLLASSLVVLPPLSSKALIRYSFFEPLLNLILVWFLSQRDCTCPCLCISYDSFLISIYRDPESSFLLRAFCTCRDGFGVTLINRAAFSNHCIYSPLTLSQTVTRSGWLGKRKKKEQQKCYFLLTLSRILSVQGLSETHVVLCICHPSVDLFSSYLTSLPCPHIIFQCP